MTNRQTDIQTVTHRGFFLQLRGTEEFGSTCNHKSNLVAVLYRRVQTDRAVVTAVILLTVVYPRLVVAVQQPTLPAAPTGTRRAAAGGTATAPAAAVEEISSVAATLQPPTTNRRRAVMFPITSLQHHTANLPVACPTTTQRAVPWASTSQPTTFNQTTTNLPSEAVIALNRPRPATPNRRCLAVEETIPDTISAPLPDPLSLKTAVIWVMINPL